MIYSVRSATKVACALRTARDILTRLLKNKNILTYLLEIFILLNRNNNKILISIGDCTQIEQNIINSN